MKHLCYVVSCLVCLFAFPAWAQNLTCEETLDRHAHHIGGEVAGSRTFRETIGPGWTFTLLQKEKGWAIRLMDKDGLDLTQITPPFHAPANPRDIEGWHFRNADNTASNDGSKNAPQALRLFVFSPALSGTGGFKPPTSDGPALSEPDPDGGRGWFRIDDYGLADLEPGQKARMVYLKFFACLTWPKTAAEQAVELDFHSDAYTDEETEQFVACSLAEPYRLNAYVKPRFLSGDIDGDDALDLFAPVVRETDGKKGIAICRAGTWFDVLGMEDPIGEVAPGYFDQIETWRLERTNDGAQGNASDQRSYERDELIIERVEKSAYAIYWTDDGYKSRQKYGPTVTE